VGKRSCRRRDQATIEDFYRERTPDEDAAAADCRSMWTSTISSDPSAQGTRPAADFLAEHPR